MEKWNASASFTTPSAWTIWRKQDMESLLRDLSDWVNHFHLAYVSIRAATTLPQPAEIETASTYRRVLNLFLNEEFQRAESLDKARLPCPKDEAKVIQEAHTFALVELQGAKEAIAELILYE